MSKMYTVYKKDCWDFWYHEGNCLISQEPIEVVDSPWLQAQIKAGNLVVEGETGEDPAPEQEPETGGNVEGDGEPEVEGATKAGKKTK